MAGLLVQRCTGDQAIDLLVRRLDLLCPLDPCELDLLRGLSRNVDMIGPGRDLARERAPVGTPRMIVSGWACRFKTLPDGRRQILSFLLAGDCIALCLRAHPLALANTITLSNVQVLALDPLLDAVRHDAARYPNLGNVLYVGQAIDEANLIEQVVRVGRRTAYERICHLLLELYHRLAQLGLARDNAFALPLTQEILADALSLSVVHVNRTLAELRREDLVEVRRGWVTLLDPDRLISIAAYRAPVPSDWRDAETS